MDNTPIPFPTPTLPYNPDSGSTPVINFSMGDGAGMHVYIVQGYNVANGGGLIDYLFVFLILAIVLLSIWGIIRGLRNV